MKIPEHKLISKPKRSKDEVKDTLAVEQMKMFKRTSTTKGSFLRQSFDLKVNKYSNVLSRMDQIKALRTEPSDVPNFAGGSPSKEAHL